ncbi:MAG: tautomerase family protein [Pseudomonadota bacterium]
MNPQFILPLPRKSIDNQKRMKHQQSTQREGNMPTIIVEADEGRTIEQKRGLVKDVTEAVCKNFNVPPQAVTILIHEQKKENRGKDGKLAVD